MLNYRLMLLFILISPSLSFAQTTEEKIETKENDLLKVKLEILKIDSCIAETEIRIIDLKSDIQKKRKAKDQKKIEKSKLDLQLKVLKDQRRKEKRDELEVNDNNLTPPDNKRTKLDELNAVLDSLNHIQN